MHCHWTPLIWVCALPFSVQKNKVRNSAFNVTLSIYKTPLSGSAQTLSKVTNTNTITRRQNYSQRWCKESAQLTSRLRLRTKLHSKQRHFNVNSLTTRNSFPFRRSSKRRSNILTPIKQFGTPTNDLHHLISFTERDKPVFQSVFLVPSFIRMPCSGRCRQDGISLKSVMHTGHI